MRVDFGSRAKLLATEDVPFCAGDALPDVLIESFPTTQSGPAIARRRWNCQGLGPACPNQKTGGVRMSVPGAMCPGESWILGDGRCVRRQTLTSL